jgi:hypothetical protein
MVVVLGCFLQFYWSLRRKHVARCAVAVAVCHCRMHGGDNFSGGPLRVAALQPQWGRGCSACHGPAAETTWMW